MPPPNLYSPSFLSRTFPNWLVLFLAALLALTISFGIVADERIIVILVLLIISILILLNPYFDICIFVFFMPIEQFIIMSAAISGMKLLGLLVLYAVLVFFF